MQLERNWTYREVMRNMKQVRKEYLLICSTFDYEHLHNRVEYRRSIKKIVYSYPFSEKNRNIIWHSLNRGYKNPLK